jgi:hypothetical protein
MKDDPELGDPTKATKLRLSPPPPSRKRAVATPANITTPLLTRGFGDQIAPRPISK